MQPREPCCSTAMHTERTEFLDLQFSQTAFSELKEFLRGVQPHRPYAYIVTPNVDHLVRLDREPLLSRLYSEANFCVCDSRILKGLARLAGLRLPLVPGSDLTKMLFAEIIRPGDRIAIVGGEPALIGDLAAKYPAIEFVHHAAPMGLRKNAEARHAAARFIADAAARFIFIVVGSPQQEMIASEVRGLPNASGVAFCVGASLEFLTGKQRRAPRILQKAGLEWAFRLASDPLRLWRRYLVDGARIFPIYAKWIGAKRWLVLIAIALLFALAIEAFVFTARKSANHPVDGTSAALQLPRQAAKVTLELPPPYLFKPVTAEEAAAQNAERPFAKRPDTAPQPFQFPNGMTEKEKALHCLAQAVYYEAASEGEDGGRAVAQVVLNRMRHPAYPASVCGVVYQGSERVTGCQFSFTCDGSLQRQPVASLWKRSEKIASQALAGNVFAPVGHATHYHANYVLPYWADSLDKTVQIGRHIFYRLKGGLGSATTFRQKYAGTEPQPVTASSTVVLPPTLQSATLAKTLIADNVSGERPENPPVVADDTSALLLDAAPSALIADSIAVPSGKAARTKTAECPAPSEGKQLKPLTADKVRVTDSSGRC